jgi:kinesin family protein 15
MIIGNVSPSLLCSHETLSTLHFVARAKCIRNRAHINLDYRGDVAVLQREIVRLNKELDDMRANNTEAAFEQAAALREALLRCALLHVLG